MRKHSIALMKVLMTFLIILSVGIAGCSSQAPSGTISPAPSAPPVTSPASTPVQTIQPLTKFEQFEKGLNDANIKYISSSKSAQMIGAEEGRGYKWGVSGEAGFGAVEIYRFKDNSEELKVVTQNKAIIIKGVGSFPVEAVNGDMVLVLPFGSKGETYKEKIMEIFYRLK
jgi:hypothetical protein